MATTTVNLGLSLDGLSNVDTTGKNNGDILVWNSSLNKWVDATPTSGGTPAGTSGQVQFNNAGAFGADSAFHWDNTNKRLGVGATPASTVRLDIRAQGALSTDIAFRVRNSADTFNIIENRGDGTSVQLVNSTTITPLIGHNIGGTNTNLWYNAKTVMSSGTGLTGFRAEASGRVQLFTEYGNSAGGGSGSGHIWHDPLTSSAWFNFGEDLTNGLGMRFGAISAGSFQPTGAWMQIAKFGGTWAQSVVSIGTFLGATSSTSPATNLGGNTFRILNGTAPTASFADTFCLYSADIVAGNAAPHFRTENGNVIKLYQQSSAGITTVADLVTILQNVGLLA